MTARRLPLLSLAALFFLAGCSDEPNLCEEYRDASQSCLQDANLPDPTGLTPQQWNTACKVYGVVRPVVAKKVDPYFECMNAAVSGVECSDPAQLPGLQEAIGACEPPKF